MDKNKTVLGLLESEIKKDYQVNGRIRLAYLMQLITQLKEKEKEHIEWAYTDVYLNGLNRLDDFRFREKAEKLARTYCEEQFEK